MVPVIEPYVDVEVDLGPMLHKKVEDTAARLGLTMHQFVSGCLAEERHKESREARATSSKLFAYDDQGD